MAYVTTNPYTGETLKTFPMATFEEVDTALDVAHHAYEWWRDEPLTERTKVLSAAADILEHESKAFASMLTLEMGKVTSEAVAEVNVCVAILRYYVKHTESLLAPKLLQTAGFGDTNVHLVNDPLGIIFAVEPWNFPYYQVIRVAAPQLAAGNVVLLKHASNVPQCAALMSELFHRAGAPDGVFTNLYLPHELTEHVIASPYVRGVALTGSERAGAVIASLAGKHLKKSTLELGGMDAFIVLKDADVAAAAEWAVRGRCRNAGQVCVASKRFIVVDDVYDEFVERYRAEAAKLVAGDPADPTTTLAPLSSVHARIQVERQVADIVAQGASVEYLAEVPGWSADGTPNEGAFYPPALITNIPEGTPAARTEIFGPVAQLYRAKDEEDAIRIANDSPYGLGGSVFSADVHHAQEIARRLDTGMVTINRSSASGPDIPFGGVKNSGYGRELIDLGLKEFVNQKVVING
ncbi:NAD-dependent succinate-semialdehyde dehydrogenase [Bifidobacterium tissieri]|uniref:NAD-dependent succinate-semialdehyde dehydrogenase n=1 Tax=Bifidobacterium tissieri TaxID=1630162 RepID=A0A5M9ZUN9_9BIFI|nr:NAD-dependent succinate-semialdehyde dehydrogenase [Bifidobacterium tissieri]KAA8830053.1 NAD-dependent succinate-semialdehyde dehydrogenase [Bifidobacterium tissieri]KAA8831260.1 NAD-dependent succinate-semialdehyde dehydrogenase [Bifidobacterium tissieri]